jgi:alkanesulfonate monooxygenase SsuD/methylene tetrahydromethanopterin reductase-like flavin-dependent oxidoreductase (luciferase family)
MTRDGELNPSPLKGDKTIELGKLGGFCFTDALIPAQLIELAQRTESLGYSALWYPEVLSYESLSRSGFLLQQTQTLIVATGIANIYARDATAFSSQRHRGK